MSNLGMLTLKYILLFFLLLWLDVTLSVKFYINISLWNSCQI